MARTKVQLNHAGMRELLNSSGIAAEMMRRAEKAADAARASAPVSTGAYRNSIHAESATTDRAVGRVVAGTDHALVVEFKTRNLGSCLDGSGGVGLIDYTTKSGKKRKATQAQIDNWTRGR